MREKVGLHVEKNLFSKALCLGRTRSSTMSLGPSGSSLYPALRHSDSLPLGNTIFAWPVSFALLLTAYWMKTRFGQLLV